MYIRFPQDTEGGEAVKKTQTSETKSCATMLKYQLYSNNPQLQEYFNSSNKWIIVKFHCTT